jgi:alkylated DNA repair dioxygenase AlkB
MNEPRVLEMPGATVLLYAPFFLPADSDRLFADLSANIAWKQEQVKLFGKTHDQPRLTAWYGDAGAEYTYSGLHLVPNPWVPALEEIKTAIETATGATFNSVLLNLYRDNKDSVGWHSDDEHGLGHNPTIASVSFGAARTFRFKHKMDRTLRREVELTHGSLLVMSDGTQTNWLHSIPRTTAPLGPRINLTFRRMVESQGSDG